ncbi:MAG: prepilin-type N-terminal cleavage/methylation domain-containing protein [Gemmatimonadota bacterium]
MKAHAGFGLIEAIVAMTLLTVGVLGLAAAAAVAQRSFASADAIERAAYAGAAVLDSLMYESAPAPGQREIRGARVSWTVRPAEGVSRIAATVEVRDAGRTRRITYDAVYSAQLVR